MGSILWLCDADQNIRSCTATRKSPFWEYTNQRSEK
jgi:hypothetical protein